VYPFAAKLTSEGDAEKHREVTAAVHSYDGAKIAMQILHSGRYGYHPLAVAPSAIKAPIGYFTPRALSNQGVLDTIDDFARCANFAARAGYDGVEIMGSEGYLINQFISNRTNKRKDEWGGSFENRIRLAKEIVRRTRAEVNKDFIVIFRLSMLDLVEHGSNWSEVVSLAKELEALGVDIINTGSSYLKKKKRENVFKKFKRFH
jgi:2,4-dienoyl-CoA reductase (NADPH2)